MGYVPPRPMFDSEPQRTRVKAPDTELLAITRGERADASVRRLGWFVLGALVGACVVWAATSDVKADVYRARLWVASELRSLHGHDDASDVSTANAPAPAPAVGPMTTPPIPTVDVGRLPRSTPRPPATATSPTFAAPSPGAPALPHAPGPR